MAAGYLLAFRDGSVFSQTKPLRQYPSLHLVFEPYAKEAHAETFAWITRRSIFAEGGLGHRGYDDSVLSLGSAGRFARIHV